MDKEIVITWEDVKPALPVLTRELSGDYSDTAVAQALWDAVVIGIGNLLYDLDEEVLHDQGKFTRCFKIALARRAREFPKAE